MTQLQPLIAGDSLTVESHDHANALAIVQDKFGRRYELHTDECHALDFASLLAACRKDAARIRELCRMVNSLSGKLGLGKKVNADDWDDIARAEIAKAQKKV